jgi:hypothetical protein
MPVTETEAQQGIINLLEGQLAEQEELFSQSLILISKLINEPSRSLKMACLEFIKEHEQKTA